MMSWDFVDSQYAGLITNIMLIGAEIYHFILVYLKLRTLILPRLSTSVPSQFVFPFQIKSAFVLHKCQAKQS